MLDQQTTDKIIKILNSQGIAIEWAEKLANEILNSLVSEDKIGCECDCCRGDHARIAKRMIEEFVETEFASVTIQTGTSLGWFKNWLSQQESK